MNQKTKSYCQCGSIGLKCVLPIVRVKIETPKGHKMYKPVSYIGSDGENVYECLYCQRAIQKDRQNGYLVEIIS